MNNRGQAGYFYLMMIGIVLFILGFELASALVTNSTNVRTNLDCGNSSISVDQKVTCGVVDIIAPLVTGLIFGLGGIAFGAKIVGVG